MRNGTMLTSSISRFHFYRYDDSQAMSIYDGGSDMYDTGNQVLFGLKLPIIWGSTLKIQLIVF